MSLRLFHTDTNTPVYCWVDLLTWKSVDEPAELLLGNVGPTEVQGYRLSADDPAQHQGSDGFAAVQIDVLPEPFVTAPDERDSGRFRWTAV